MHKQKLRRRKPARKARNPQVGGRAVAAASSSRDPNGDPTVEGPSGSNPGLFLLAGVVDLVRTFHALKIVVLFFFNLLTFFVSCCLLFSRQPNGRLHNFVNFILCSVRIFQWSRIVIKTDENSRSVKFHDWNA